MANCTPSSHHGSFHFEIAAACVILLLAVAWGLAAVIR